MKKYTIAIEPTTLDNASSSWTENVEMLIKKYPISLTISGFGGGYFESWDKVNEFIALIPAKYTTRKFSPNFAPNAYGTWELSGYTAKEAKNYGWQ